MSHYHRRIDELFGQLLKFLAPLNGLSQRVSLFGGDVAGHVLTAVPDLVFEVRSPVLAGVPERGVPLGLERAALHTLDLLHALEDLLSLVKESIHGGIIPMH